MSMRSSPNTHENIERCGFSRHSPSFFLHFFSAFSSFFFQVWHLWQQKNNIAVGKCAPTRAREKRCPKILPPRFCSFSHFFIFSSSSSFSLTSPSSLLGHLALVILRFCYMRIADLVLSKEKTHFSSIFSRFGAISTHIQIGGSVVNPNLFKLGWTLNSCDFLGRLTKKSYLCGSRGMSICISRCRRKKGKSCRPQQPFSLLPLQFSKGRLAIPTYRHARYHHLRLCP